MPTPEETLSHADLSFTIDVVADTPCDHTNGRQNSASHFGMFHLYGHRHLSSSGGFCEKCFVCPKDKLAKASFIMQKMVWNERAYLPNRLLSHSYSFRSSSP